MICTYVFTQGINRVPCGVLRVSYNVDVPSTIFHNRHRHFTKVSLLNDTFVDSDSDSDFDITFVSALSPDSFVSG